MYIYINTCYGWYTHHSTVRQQMAHYSSATKHQRTKIWLYSDNSITCYLSWRLLMRHHMDTFYAILAFWMDPPQIGPVIHSFDVTVVVTLNKLLNKQSSFVDLRRHSCDFTAIQISDNNNHGRIFLCNGQCVECIKHEEKLKIFCS